MEQTTMFWVYFLFAVLQHWFFITVASGIIWLLTYAIGSGRRSGTIDFIDSNNKTAATKVAVTLALVLVLFFGFYGAYVPSSIKLQNMPIQQGQLNITQ